MINYELSETVISLENGIYSTVYGINAEDERGNIHMSFSDISPNKDRSNKALRSLQRGLSFRDSFQRSCRRFHGRALSVLIFESNGGIM